MHIRWSLSAVPITGKEQTQGQLELTPLSSLNFDQPLPRGNYIYDIGSADYHVPTTKLTAQQRGTLANAALQSLRNITTKARYAVLTCPHRQARLCRRGICWARADGIFCPALPLRNHHGVEQRDTQCRSRYQSPCHP